jgi:hypothetical protein
MDRILETHTFGIHTVDVVEHVDDEGTSYSVIVDGIDMTEPPLQTSPTFEDVVRLYSRRQQPGVHEVAGQ